MAIYHVTTPSGERLIEAKTANQAINYACKKDVTARALSSIDAVKMARELTLESANEEQESNEGVK